MKQTALAILAVLGLGIKPGTAHAGDEGWVALGGFIGGAVFSSIANQRNHRGYHADAHVCHSGCNHGSVTVVVGSGGRSGYYEYRQVKRWKPGYHTYVRDNCGRRVRIWREGYYTHDRVRVWVPIASHSYKYGNGHRRDYSQSYTNHRPDRHSGHDRDRNRENAYDRSHDRRH